MDSVFLYPILLCERVLLLLVIGYDKVVYNPLQACLSPLVALVPRQVTIGGHRVTLFTANGVTLARTGLVVPVACCLRWGYFQVACVLILFHDFLDHLDGIVAKAQRRVYGPSDDPLLGAFLDAFCDKVVNVMSLWTILLLTNYNTATPHHILIYMAVCSTVIGYEAVLGIVRVQDYYRARYARSTAESGTGKGGGVSAVMEGKLKEKLESVGLALLCLAIDGGNPMDSWVGISGITCLAISLRFAHSSLTHKLRKRRKTASNLISTATTDLTTELSNGREQQTAVTTVTELNHRADHVHHITKPEHLTGTLSHKPNWQKVMSVPDFVHFSMEESDSSCLSSEEDEHHRETKVDKVYTVGCFDLFHRGHVNLLKNMRRLGNQVIVGVHTDESITKLKRRVPIDNTEKRMANVKRYADQVFVVSSTDPAPYLRCCVHLEEGQTALYVRGDDMPQFPGREVCEEMMPVKLLPYTQGVSATMLRAQLLAGTNGALPTSHTKED